MPYVIFYDKEHCPHCEDNKHHNHTADKKIFPHKCEFCNRIDAKGDAPMTIEYFDRARKAEWKEILMFGRMKKESEE